MDFKQYKTHMFFLALLAVFDFFIWRAVFANALHEQTALYFLDIGQGDSELVELPHGVQVLIDGGTTNSKILGELSKILPPGDRYIDLLVMSHPQLDHFGGFIDVLKNYDVGAFIGNGREGTAKAYGELATLIKEKNVSYILFKEGDNIRYGDAVFETLSPNEAFLKSEELNDTTVVLKFTSGNLSALYTGDIGFNVEDYLHKKHDINAQVLKIGHHGSRFSSGADFLKAVQPSVAVIEVGKNTYGHPTKQAIDRLAGTGARILRTDQNGTIKIVINGDKLQIYAEKP